MRTLSARLAILFMACGCLDAAAVAADHPDLGGIWQIDAPIVRLRTADGGPPPLNAAAAQLYARRQAQLQRGDRSFDPTVTLCKPPGSPRILYEPFPIEIVQTNKQVIFTYQWNRLYRIVDIDGDNQVIAPTYFGTSNARWAGSTLRIDVRSLHDDTLLDAAGMPHSDALHLVESYALRDHGQRLDVRLHFDDPQTFTRPWDARISLKRLPTDRLGEDVCEERVGLVK